jgi:NAD dependent epimerase/dehydratase family enzyme
VKPIKMGFGAAMGNGKQIQAWIHIKDLVNIYYSAVEKHWDGVFNAVAPNFVTNSDLTKAIAKKFKKPLFLPNIPQFIMKLILGEMSVLLFSSKNLSAQKIQKNGYEFQIKTVSEALNDLYK